MALDLMPGFGAFTASTTSAAQTWDSSKKSTNITLSGGDLTAQGAGGSAFNTVLGQTGKSTGKWCIAMQVSAWNDTQPNYFLFGIGATNGTYDDVYLGNYSNSIGQQGNSAVYTSGFTAGVSQSFVVAALNDWIAFYVDFDAGKVWMQSNDYAFQNGQDPATGANPWATFTPGGTYYPGCSLYANEAGNKITILSGASFPTTVPSGFTAW